MLAARKPRQIARERYSRALAAVILGAVVSLLIGVDCPQVSAAQAELAGTANDGSKAFFTTTAKLVPGDTDNGFVDVYERFYDGAPGIETHVTREISTGPTGGNDSYDVSFDAVSDDGSKAFFSTAESLVPDDQDRSRDIYERDTTTGETRLISGGAASCAPCGNRESPATFVGAARDGSQVFFSTQERLVTGDSDEASDVYARDPSQPEAALASPGGAGPVTFDGASLGGSRVVFETSDQLAAGDGDAESDIYERDLDGAVTKLASLAGTCPSGLSPEECTPIYRDTGSAGSIVFETKAQLLFADEDSYQDVYEWSPTGGIALISTGAEGEQGTGSNHAVYAGMAAADSDVFFETEEALSSFDSDEANDVYARSGGSTALISPGGQHLPAFFDGVSANGGSILFSTREALTGADGGDGLDVYERNGATTSLITPGSSEFDATFVGASADAGHVFYSTAQKVTPEDLDSIPDVYGRAMPGSPSLISVGPVGGNGAFTPHLSAVSPEGGHAFFTTRERLTVDDNFAGENDVYDRSAVGTLLVSVGNSAEVQLGPPAPRLTTTSPGSPGSSAEPRVVGEAEIGTSIKIYTTPDCSGAPAAVGTVSDFVNTGIRVTVKVASTTTFRATATNSSGDTSACSSSAVTYTQQNPAPPPSEEGPSGGHSGGESKPSGGSTTAGGGAGSGGSVVGPAGGTKGGDGTQPKQVEIRGVVYVAPQTRITFAPASKTRFRSPVFRFVDETEQPGTKFFCRIDRRPWKGCSSPFKAKQLKLGKHIFTVKGESFAGQREEHPVRRSFSVVSR